MNYTCENCGHQWSSKDYDEDTQYESHAGTNCPECNSTNVGGVDIND